MKTFFTILSILIFSLSSFASPYQSRLSVSTTDNSVLRIIVDDRYDRQGSSILIDGLSTGYHNIKIYQARNTGWYDKRNTFDLVYSGGVLFKPMHHIDILVSRFGKVVVDERQMDRMYDRNGNDRRDDDFPRRGNRRPDNNYNLYYNAMSNDMFKAAKEAIRNERFHFHFLPQKKHYQYTYKISDKVSYRQNYKPSYVHGGPFFNYEI